MNAKLLNITRNGFAAALLAGALGLGTAGAASASVRVPFPCPGGTCGGHYSSQVAPGAASVGGAVRVPFPCPDGTCGGRGLYAKRA